MHNQLTVCTKLIFTRGKQTVCLFLCNFSCPSDKKIIVSCKVVIVAIFNKLITSKYAIFSKVHISVFSIHKRTRYISYEFTVISKLVTSEIFAAECNCAFAYQCITVIIEIVFFAFNFKPLILIISKRVVITSALYTVNDECIPSTDNFTLFAFDLVYAVFSKSERTYGCIPGAVIEVISTIIKCNKAFFLEVTHKVHPARTVVVEACI